MQITMRQPTVIDSIHIELMNFFLYITGMKCIERPARKYPPTYTNVIIIYTPFVANQMKIIQTKPKAYRKWFLL